MNLDELRAELVKCGVPETLYQLSGGLPNEKCCIGQKDGRWEVYYSERGSKTSLKFFDDEHSACLYFLRWVTR